MKRNVRDRENFRGKSFEKVALDMIWLCSRRASFNVHDVVEGLQCGRRDAYRRINVWYWAGVIEPALDRVPGASPARRWVSRVKLRPRTQQREVA